MAILAVLKQVFAATWRRREIVDREADRINEHSLSVRIGSKPPDIIRGVIEADLLSAFVVNVPPISVSPVSRSFALILAGFLSNARSTLPNVRNSKVTNSMPPIAACRGRGLLLVDEIA